MSRTNKYTWENGHKYTEIQKKSNKKTRDHEYCIDCAFHTFTELTHQIRLKR